jgi:hypothetical protein
LQKNRRLFLWNLSLQKRKPSNNLKEIRFFLILIKYGEPFPLL